ncbi:unnamed protein product, partial [Mesorhabditis spiculigera]
MGEFVELRIEKLVPFFEQLKNVEILKDEEVNELVKRCRRYEYRIGKKQKTEADYLVYVDYLKDLMSLVKKRRKKLDYMHRYKDIDGALATKIGGLYYACAHRFAGNLPLWNSCLDFLTQYKLNGVCSKAFTVALQFNSSNVPLRCRSAVWELTGNSSIDNARTQLQQAIRGDAQEIEFWITLLKVEILYVDRIKTRLEFLKRRGARKTTAEEEKDMEEELNKAPEEVSDAVLDLEVAEIVLKQSLKQVQDPSRRAEMLYRMWQTCREIGPSAAKIEAKVFERINELEAPGEKEFKLLAKAEAEAVAEEKDLYDTYEDILKECHSEQMYRKLLQIFGAAGEERALAVERLREGMIKAGYASMGDIQQTLENLDETDSSHVARIIDIAKLGLEKTPCDAKLWEARIEAEITQLERGPKRRSQDKVEPAIMSLFDEAFQKVRLHEQLPIWRLAIDFAVEHFPATVDNLFAQCFKAADASVASEMKVARLEYLDAAQDSELFRNEARRLMDMKPNSTSVYEAVAKLESKRAPDFDKALVETSWKAAINENDKDPEAWLGYLKFLLTHRPEGVADVHKRAKLNLDGSAAEQLATGWMKALVDLSNKQEPMSHNAWPHQRPAVPAPRPIAPHCSQESAIVHDALSKAIAQRQNIPPGYENEQRFLRHHSILERVNEAFHEHPLPEKPPHLVGSGRTIKQLIMIPFNHQPLDIMAHRVGNTIYVDQVKRPNQGNNQSSSSQQWESSGVNIRDELARTFVESSYSNVDEPTTKIWEGLSESNDEMWDLSNAVSVMNVYPSLRSSNTSLNVHETWTRPKSLTYKISTDTGSSMHVWEFSNLRMLVDHEIPVLSGENFPSISIRADQELPISILTGVDMWLDQMIKGLDGVVVIHQGKGSRKVCIYF